MVKSLTIGLVDDGVATWNPVSDGNLLVTGGAGCGKTWWLTHTRYLVSTKWGNGSICLTGMWIEVIPSPCKV